MLVSTDTGMLYCYLVHRVLLPAINNDSSPRNIRYTAKSESLEGHEPVEYEDSVQEEDMEAAEWENEPTKSSLKLRLFEVLNL